MSNKVVLEVPEDPKLSLHIAVRNGKESAPTVCAFCNGKLDAEPHFTSDVRPDVAICVNCVAICFTASQEPAEPLNSADEAFAKMHQWREEDWARARARDPESAMHEAVERARVPDEEGGFSGEFYVGSFDPDKDSP